jgi:predicted exporter
LSRTEAAVQLLDSLVQAGTLQGYDSPSTLLPSRAVQLRRQAVLPTTDVLRANVQAALSGGNLNAKAFEPFIADVAAARQMAPLALNYYDKTIIGRWLTAQIIRSADGVAVLILLHGVRPGSQLNQSIAQAKLTGVSLIDLKRDVEVLVADYRQQAMRTALIGAALIFLVLVVQLRRAPAVLSMVATLVSTVVISAAALLLCTGHLTVFNLVALLLVVGVASNYTLFFSTLPADPQKRQRASVSVLLAASSTFIGFAMLATSSTPILATIGLTVAIGAAIGLLASMVFSPS